MASSCLRLSLSCRRPLAERVCQAADLGLADGMLTAGMSGQFPPGQGGKGGAGQGGAGGLAAGVVTG
jgi:hypothetical protein